MAAGNGKETGNRGRREIGTAAATATATSASFATATTAAAAAAAVIPTVLWQRKVRVILQVQECTIVWWKMGD